MTAQEKSPELLLPEDGDRRRRLQNWLNARRAEIERYGREHPAQHPDIRDRVMAQQICEVKILEQLLASGKVVAWDLSKEILLERKQKDQGSIQAFGVSWLDAWAEITTLLRLLS